MSRPGLEVARLHTPCQGFPCRPVTDRCDRDHVVSGTCSVRLDAVPEQARVGGLAERGHPNVSHSLFEERFGRTANTVCLMDEQHYSSYVALRPVAPGSKGSRPICSRTVTNGGLVSVRRCQFAPSTTSV